jgi:ABC-type glycerol-3-phosphate transport system permease component
MGTLLLPLEVTLLANVQTIRELGWVNSNAGLVLPFAATAFGRS